jgi:hypothetical protein
MPPSQQSVERSGDLKRALVSFAQGRRFRRALDEATLAHFDVREVQDEGALLNFLDAFALQHRLADGKTVVEHFVDAHPELPEAESVGIICDTEEGIYYFPDFGLLEEAFATPALAAGARHREVVLGYLESEGASPLPLRRLAERDPERATQVFRRVLGRPRFSWERDGEALLRRYKRQYYERPPLPSMVPVSDPVARSTARQRRRPRRAPRGGRGR